MAQIRDTIELLTKVLRENGTSKLKAEMFRLAKFNNDDAVGPFWKLLFEMVYFLRYKTIDDVSVLATSELTTEELVVFVKKEMQYMGFFSRDFASLPMDMTRGSRDLLLAFGWVMCKAGIIDKFMENCASPLAEDTSALYQIDTELDESFRKRNQLSPRAELNPTQKVKYLLWLNGKLRLSLRNLYTVQRQKANLTHKIHKSTEGVSLTPDRNHLSVLEAYMLRHPELLKKNLQLLERDNVRLQNLLLWKEREDIFWKWMESVLDAKLVEIQQSQSRSMHTPHYFVSQEGVDKMEISREKLRDAIVKYESIIEHLERLWDIKKSEVTQKDLDNLIASIELEISIQRANIALSMGNDPLPQPISNDQPRWAYVRPSPLKRQSIGSATMPPGGGQSGMASLSESMKHNVSDIKNEMSELHKLVDNLRSEIQNKQDLYQSDLDDLADKFDDVVCIPPMARKIP